MKTAQMEIGKRYVVRGAGESCLLVSKRGSPERPKSALNKFVNEHGVARYARSIDVLREATGAQS
jgi:hypothetical protein